MAPHREVALSAPQGFGIQRRASGGEAWGRAHVEELSQTGSGIWKSGNSGETPQLGLVLQGFLLHLLVEVDALCAEDSAIGGRWGLETGIEARERPGGKVFEATFGPSGLPKESKSLGMDGQSAPHSLLLHLPDGESW